MNDDKYLMIGKKDLKTYYLNPSFNDLFFSIDFDLPITYINMLKVKHIIFFILGLFFIFSIFRLLKAEYETRDLCESRDPIFMMRNRLNIPSDKLCIGVNSFHKCYKNDNNNDVDNYHSKKGVICEIKNFILDPSKWQSDENLKYSGPFDYRAKGLPLVTKGLFNLNCVADNEINDVNKLYDFYFNSFNYRMNSTSYNNVKEFGKKKIVFFISRNHDSTNLFHGGSGFINAFSLMNILNLEPQNIQIIFLDSINITNDPFYSLYKNLISRGGEPIHISQLKNKYYIYNAIHIPLNYDSPCFIVSDVPKCNYQQSETYKLLNKSITEYINISPFRDSIGFDKEIFFYPKTIINPNSNIYNKFVTIQWRRVWPKERTGQQRVLGNGPELTEALAELLPKNIMIRLVDTARLTMEEQIAIMHKTDYLIGQHGSGLFLSIFLPTQSIVQQFYYKTYYNSLHLMSSLSGHKTYSDYISAKVEIIGANEVLFFNVQEFTKVILKNMKKSGFNIKNY